MIDERHDLDSMILPTNETDLLKFEINIPPHRKTPTNHLKSQDEASQRPPNRLRRLGIICETRCFKSVLSLDGRPRWLLFYAPIWEANFHRTEPTSWRPRIIILVISFVRPTVNIVCFWGPTDYLFWKAYIYFLIAKFGKTNFFFLLFLLK